MRTADDILALFEERKRHYGPLHAAMGEIAAIYDGDAVIDLPDMGRDEQSSVPNLLAQGVDQTAGRISSTMPQIIFASEKPGDRAADRRARTSKDVIGGWWYADRLPLKMKQRARHAVAYGLAPAVIGYCPERKMPTWEVRSPRETYPSVDRIPGTVLPTDVIFAYERSLAWLIEHGYGAAVQSIVRNVSELPRDQLFRVLEYVDDEQRHMVLTGWSERSMSALPRFVGTYGYGQMARTATMENYRTYGVMTASVPTRLTLNRPGGQFDSMTAMYYTQAKLMALEVLAVEKDIFPDTYLEGRQGETPKFLDGPYDGRTGEVNVVQGGVIKMLQSSPGYTTTNVVDRLERAQRVTAGIPSEYGGESGTNIRTGRRGDAVLSAVIDFPIAEVQEILAYALIDEDKAAIALAKRYDRGATRRLFVGSGNSRRPVTYVADKVFTHDEHMVAYPVAGTDMNSLLVGLGQRVGLGTMSKQTAAELDPFIEDPETEQDRIVAEGLTMALVQSIQNQAVMGPQQGGLAPLVVAKIATLVANDKMDLAQAFTKVTEDALAEQQAAADAAAGGPPPTADAAMAGNAVASMAGPQSPIPGAPQGTKDLGSLLATLRTPLRATGNRIGVPDRSGSVAV